MIKTSLTRFDMLPPSDYEFKEYPMWVNHPGKPATIVQDAKEHAQLLKEWGLGAKAKAELAEEVEQIETIQNAANPLLEAVAEEKPQVPAPKKLGRPAKAV